MFQVCESVMMDHTEAIPAQRSTLRLERLPWAAMFLFQAFTRKFMLVLTQAGRGACVAGSPPSQICMDRHANILNILL